MVFPYFRQREWRVKERFYQNQRISFESLHLGIASPEQIRGWAQRKLPNGSVVGEVLFAKTVDYKTLKPLRDGLFCERTFGPIKDFHCACGKRQPSDEVSFCPDCEVEYYPATIRRHRLGYIELCSGSVHIWYFKGRPNYLSILLDKKRKSLETLIYCTNVLVNAHSIGAVPTRILTNNFPVPADQLYKPGQTIPVSAKLCCDSFRQRGLLKYFISAPEPEDLTIPNYCSGEHLSNQMNVVGGPMRDEEEIGNMLFPDLLLEYEQEREDRFNQALNHLGGQAIVNLFNNTNFQLLGRYLATEILELNPRISRLANPTRLLFPSNRRKFLRLMNKRLATIRRFKLVQTFLASQRNPAWMVLFALPVLPPTIRPISTMENGTLVASDMNRLYQRLMFRNSRMKRLLVSDLDTIGFHQRLVQEAVDAVLENGKGGSPAALGSDSRPLKSLADRLKGKRGRFRLHLLGKRVDYSGRSVIVVGPKLRLHECGLPREMAVHLFTPFLIRRLLEKRYVDNFLRAKVYIQIEHPIIWPTLLEIMGEYPILLNRAPTLHRLGIQAFQPRLVATHAILLHPLVCSAFNADFDGDQMAVHVPLSFHARAEAWKLLWSRNNLLAPATGDPILAPSQDMILGSYYLTTSGEPNEDKRRALALADAEGPQAPMDLAPHDLYFNDFDDVLRAFYEKLIRVRTPIWLRLPLNQISQTGAKPHQPTEVHVNADGFGFAFFEGVHQRRRWPLSTNTGDFLSAYTLILSQFADTTAGRVLINKLMTSRGRQMSGRVSERVDTILNDIFDKQRQKEEVAALAELRSLPNNDDFAPFGAALPGVF